MDSRVVAIEKFPKCHLLLLT